MYEEGSEAIQRLTELHSSNEAQMKQTIQLEGAAKTRRNINND